MKTYIITYIQSGYFHREEIQAKTESGAIEKFHLKIGNYFIHSIQTK